ncbi:MAG: N-6 DNA methylase, partial [Planctomycetaceae bacterium]|nr:N-6 DNA methylase [Planctomycetaceae bacterium]
MMKEFNNIKIEGGMFPAELLCCIAALETKKIPYLTSDDYHLGSERLGDAITRAWNLARGHWERFKQKRKNVAVNDVGTTMTRNDWLLPLLKILDYGQLPKAKAAEINGKVYPISHEAKEKVLIHLVGFGQDLDRRDMENKGGAKVSPHSMVQEYLNRKESFIWAFLSNGLKFRIIRDNVSLIRPAYVEFDLESIFEQESFSDFFVFYLLTHQSRVEEREEKRVSENEEEKKKVNENNGEIHTSLFLDLPAYFCILERWYRISIDNGVRVLDDLRSGVMEAIKMLGTGFLEQPKNHELRNMLQNNQLTKTQFYHEILRIVYRLIFLYVAEDRNLLFATNAKKTNREIYKKYYSVSRLRNLARKRKGSRHLDLWRSLRWLFKWLDKGQDVLELPEVGSFLFRDNFIPTLTQFELNNDALLEAIRHLTFTSKNKMLQAVDYRNMGTEELGSVYESLLEMHPDVDALAYHFDLRNVSGNERKTTGSYYTPASLVNSLLDSALEPVIEETIREVRERVDGRSKEGKQHISPSSTNSLIIESLLNLKICDPACGSGHFLIGAAHRLAKRIAEIRSGDEEPSPLEIQHALREVVSRCIYGVDINPLAVELCKISLWMDAMEPGKPLAFLDHHVKCGNSLIGATPELLKQGIPDEAFDPIEGDDKKFAAMYKKRNREHRTRMEGHHQEDLSDKYESWEKQGDLTKLFHCLPTMNNEREKEKSYYTFIDSVKYSNLRRFPDAWCAAFVWKKHKNDFDYPITELEFRRIEKNLHNCPLWMKEEIQRLAKQYNFFHWYLEFPDVFEYDDKIPQKWKGGFDAVLGNPPWERIKLQEKEWFEKRNTEIANAPNAAARKKMIDALKQKDFVLYQEFLEALRKSEGESKFIRLSGRYPLCGRGDVNTYTIFAELNRQLLSRKGRVGCIVPSGIATDDTTKFFFQDLMSKNSLISLFDFENRKKIFQAVDSRMKFSLLTMKGNNVHYSSASPLTTFAFFLLDTKDLDDEEKCFHLTPQEIEMINPNTRTCPIFRSVKDAELTKAIYRRVPVLIKEARDEQKEVNPWGITFSRMFDMSNDSHLFHTKEQLESKGFILEGNHFVRKKERYLPLYEAKMIHQFNHRFGDYADLPPESKSTQLPNIPPERLNNPNYAPLPRYWVTEDEVKKRIPADTKYLMGWRDITNSTNERTAITSVMSLAAISGKLPIFFSKIIKKQLLILSDMASFVHDYLTRQKIGGTDLSFFISKQIPIILPEIYDSMYITSLFSQSLILYILELTYTSYDLRDFAKACGDNGEPFQWNEERRFLLRCELDALYFGLYLGLGEWSAAEIYKETPEQHAELIRYFPKPIDAIDYIMETFPIVKRKD